MDGRHAFALPSCIAPFHLPSPRMGGARGSSVLSSLEERNFAEVGTFQPSRTESSPTCSKVLPLRHGGWVPRVMQAGPGQKSQTATRGAHNCPAVTSTPPLSPRPAGERADRHAGGMQPYQGAHPFDSDASSMGAQAHTSCNRRVGYYVREAAPPLAPVPCLLDCGTGAATRGNPVHGPTVPTEHIGHGSVSRGRRRDGRYGQKWAGSNGGSRRAKAAVKSSAGSCPLLGQ